MFCPLCHTPNRDNARFCKGCGQLLQTSDDAATGQAEQSASARQAPGTPPSLPPLPAHDPGPQSQEPAPSPDAQQQQATTKGGEEYDISLAPTQILTPQQMIAYHARRWQHELEHESQQRSDPARSAQGPADIAEAPTMLFTPMPAPTAASAQAQPDVSDMPTILTPPIDESVQPASPAQPPSPDYVETVIAPADRALASGAARADNGHKDNQSNPKESSATATQASPGEAARTSGQPDSAKTAASPAAGEKMEQSAQEVEEQQNQTQASPENFPALAVGAKVGDRYEVTQVINDAPEEHLYEVTDQQGYRHCWNCSSEQNVEGDEFCIDCGAELLNASYILHEYPATDTKNNDSHVLQGVIVNTFIDQDHTYVVEQPQAAQTSFPNGVHLLASCDSDAGTVRRSEPNEDSTLVLMLERVHESIATPAGIFVIADGMGGHDDGQGASRMTIGVIAERIVRELLMPPLTSEKASEPPQQMDEDSLVAILQGAIEDANNALCQTNQRNKTDAGSTLTGFMMMGDHTYIFNVGDSRTYMHRDSKLYQLTNDHSLVGQLVAGGLIEPDEVYTDPRRSQIYRSIGDKQHVQIDIFKQQVHPGDILLSCSDGLWEMVRDPQITDILNNAPDPQTACTLLIEAANTNGGEDNVSAVVVFVR